jgi:hypothetical protein
VSAIQQQISVSSSNSAMQFLHNNLNQLQLFLLCSLAGDYGFDPLGLASDPDMLKW